MVRPMVHSTKHYVQQSIASSAGGAVTNVTLVSAVPVADKDAVFEVEEGSSVKAIYVEFWIRTAGATAGSGQIIIHKRIADSTQPSAADMAALGDWDNKKNILYTSMGLYNDNDADAIPVVRQWIKIPKSKQRMGLGDAIDIAFFAAVDTNNICGFATYKEYT